MKKKSERSSDPPPPPWPTAAPWWPLTAVAGVALVLSGWALGRESLWFDEAWSIQLAARPIWETVSEYLRTNREGPPLYYLLLHFWMLGLGSSEVALRSLSVLAAVGAIVFHFRVLEELFGRRIAVLASLLTATSPAFVHFAQEGRNYSLTLFWLALSATVFVRFLRDPGYRTAVLVGGVHLAALMTHVLTVEILLAENAIVLLFYRHSSSLLRRWFAVQLVLAASTLSTLLLLPQAGARGSWVPAPNPRSLWNALAMCSGIGFAENPFAARRFGLSLQDDPLKVLTFSLFAFALGLGLLDLLRRLRRGGTVEQVAGLLLLGTALLAFVLPLALSIAWVPLFLPRYLVLAVPYCAGLVALGVDATFRRREQMGMILALLLVGLSLRETGLALKRKEKDDWRQASAYVEQEIRPGEALLVSDGRGVVPFSYYYHGPVTPIPVAGTYGLRESAAQVESFLASIVPEDGTFWLVMPWGGAVEDGRTGLWSYFEARQTYYRRIGGGVVPGTWGGVRIHHYQRLSGWGSL